MLRELAVSALVNLLRSLPAREAASREQSRRAFRESSKAFRRELRRLSGSALRKLKHPRPFDTRLALGEVRSIVICRLNGRLGNSLLLTPLVRTLHELLPNACIDLALSFPKAQELFGQLPGVRRIIRFPHKDPRAAWRFPAAVRELRAAHYDLAIDPVPESTSGRIALTLCRARFRLGFDTSTQWASLTHAVPRPEEVLHHGAEPVYLVARGLELPAGARTPVTIWLPLDPAELAAGRERLTDALRAAVAPVAPSVAARSEPIGFFANATGAKKLGPSWWLDFWAAFLELEPGVIPVEFLPAPDSARIDARFPSLHVRSLRDLAATISATRMFIAPDAGPMHLASATTAPTVALFCASEISRYRPLKSCDLAIDVNRCSAREAALRCHDARGSCIS
jgi:ADP-heptose:LPS heptosyltransferase